MNAGDVISTVALLAAFVGLVFTGIEIRQSNSVRRATFYKELYESFFLSPEMRTVFELMEDNKWKFDDKFGAENDEEFYRRRIAFERLLAHLEVICSLYHRGLITSEDMEEFEYNIQRIVKYPDFGNYPAVLERWRNKDKLLRAPYVNFRYYIHSKRKHLLQNYEKEEKFSPHRFRSIATKKFWSPRKI